jgi:biotin-dependent carboxylase-like uncharacterized protein
MSLIVEHPGARSLLQDGGRPGSAALGVSPSGAFDRHARRQANTLLGNTDEAAAIEVLLGGLILTATAEHTVSVTGAVGPITIDGRQVTHGRALRLLPGQRLKVGAFTSGLRAYVAVAGGFRAEDELGSLSTDTLSGLGPPPLAPGSEFAAGPAGTIPELQDVPALTLAGTIALDVVLGPRDNWFTQAAIATLLTTGWTVTPASDRIGVRLDGAVLERTRNDELPSEPCVRGSVQIASDGYPIVFGPDHPVTGGYPVIAVVIDGYTDRLAQARPGDVVHFGRRQAP